MPARAPFLNTTYSGYHHRERPAADEELTRVGPSTPCGEYLRRFWQPVIRTSELEGARFDLIHGFAAINRPGWLIGVRDDDPGF